MTRDDEVSYLRRRANQERESAAAAASVAIERLHRTLASEYDRRATETANTGVAED